MGEYTRERWAKIRRWYVDFAMIFLHACFLFILANGGLYVYYQWRAKSPKRATHVRTLLQDSGLALQQIYPGWRADDVEQLLHETYHRPFVYAPYTGFREAPFAGRFIHVTETGYRLSQHQAPWPPEPHTLNVFFFGGSTTFGFGLPDHETVPSFLQGLLREVSGKNISVYNFGCSNYYSTQERIWFEQLLLEGHRPHVVLFMDGLNDFGKEGILRAELPHSLAERAFALYEGLPLSRFIAALRRRMTTVPDTVAASASWQTEVPDSERIEAVLRRYLTNKNMITALAEAFGVIPVFVWQPVPTYQYDVRLHPFVRPGWRGPLLTQPGYQRAAEYVRTGGAGRHLIWCAHLQANAQEPLYVDRWHYNAKFSRQVASCIVQGLQEQQLWTAVGP